MTLVTRLKRDDGSFIASEGSGRERSEWSPAAGGGLARTSSSAGGPGGGGALGPRAATPPRGAEEPRDALEDPEGEDVFCLDLFRPMGSKRGVEGGKRSGARRRVDGGVTDGGSLTAKSLGKPSRLESQVAWKAKSLGKPSRLESQVASKR